MIEDAQQNKYGNNVINIPFEIKEADIQETGFFKGYGSVFNNQDSHNDIILPGAFAKTVSNGGRNGTGVAMLYQHDPKRPIGIWTMIAEDKKGLQVEGRLAMTVQDGKEAYELMKIGALKGLSIGYDSVLHEYDEKKKLRYLKEIELWEISPVTFGSNKKALITTVKSIEDAKTERELESVLRDSGLSKAAAQYVVKLCKPSLREAGDDFGSGMLSGILDGLKEVNSDLNEFLEFKKVIPFQSCDLMDESEKWDAGAQVKKASVDDLKVMCAWYDSDNADKKSSYKMPHHMMPMMESPMMKDYMTNWHGVANAMARLMQPGTMIPDSDRKGVYNHLAKHYKEFKKPAPEFKNYGYSEWEEKFSHYSGLSEILDSLVETGMMA